MQRVNPKTGAKETIFNKYKLNSVLVCPECKRPLDENDTKLINSQDHIICKKCGAILEK